MPNERKTTRAPGEGRKGPFTKEQNKLIEGSITEWHNFSLVQNPKDKGRGIAGKLTKWKQQEAEKILKDPLFEALPAGFNYKQTKEAIVRKFTNYRNNRKKTMDDQESEVKALKEAAAALLDLKSFTTGRELFKEQMHDEIVARRTAILLQSQDKCKLGAYQKALAELWAESDQAFWEEAAADRNKDVHSNRERLNQALYPCLRGLCQSGALGNMEAMLFLAYRDNTGRVDSSFLEAHHDNDVEPFSQASSGEDIEKFRLCFERWAEKILPQEVGYEVRSSESPHTIRRDDKGMPLFPTLNLDKENTDSLRKVIQDYFGDVWKFNHPEDPEVPWKAMASTPEDFHQTDIFQLNPSMKQPSNMSVTEVYEMAIRLMAISTSAATPALHFSAPFSQPTSAHGSPALEGCLRFPSHSNRSPSHVQEDHPTTSSTSMEGGVASGTTRPADDKSSPSNREPSVDGESEALMGDGPLQRHAPEETVRRSSSPSASASASKVFPVSPPTITSPSAAIPSPVAATSSPSAAIPQAESTAERAPSPPPSPTHPVVLSPGTEKGVHEAEFVRLEEMRQDARSVIQSRIQSQGPRSESLSEHSSGPNVDGQSSEGNHDEPVKGSPPKTYGKKKRGRYGEVRRAGAGSGELEPGRSEKTVVEDGARRTSRRGRPTAAEKNTPSLIGQKRPHADTEPDQDIYDHRIVLIDGRAGTFKRNKYHQGAYFYEEGKGGKGEWMNEPWDAVRMPSLI